MPAWIELSCYHSCTGCDTDVQYPLCGGGVASCRGPNDHPIYSECVPNHDSGSCECRLASECIKVYISIALSPGHSHVFNVATLKTWESPGMRLHQQTLHDIVI